MGVRNFRRQDGPGFAFALCALLFALTFRALVPTGFMLDNRTDGVELVLCGSDGLQTVVVGADGRPGKSEHPEDRKAEAVCPFVGITAITPDHAGPVAPSRTPWFVRPATIPAVAQRDVRNPRGPPPPLRGPPFLMV